MYCNMRSNIYSFFIEDKLRLTFCESKTRKYFEIISEIMREAPKKNLAFFLIDKIW